MPLLRLATPVRQIRSRRETRNHRQRHYANRSIVQRPPSRDSQPNEQNHREKETAHARSPDMFTNPNLNNGAQGRIRTSVALRAADLQSAAFNHSATCAKNPHALFALHNQTLCATKSALHNKNSQARTYALHSPLENSTTVLPRLPCAKAATLSSPTGEIWSWRRDLNPRPSDYKSDALPAELRQPARSPWRGLKRTTSFELPDARDNF